MQKINYSFPSFFLDDYVLRKIRFEDIGQVFAGLSNPDVIAHYGVSYDSLEATSEQMNWYEKILTEKSGIWWGIAKLDSDELIGACGFNDWVPAHRTIHLGYWLLPEYWRRGIARKAIPYILRYAFNEMNVHRIHADVEPENLPSSNLLRKLGFTYEGTLRDVECKNQEYVSLMQFGLIENDVGALALRDDLQVTS